VRLARSTDAGFLGAFFLESWKEAGPEALGFTRATEKDIEEIASGSWSIYFLGQDLSKEMLLGLAQVFRKCRLRNSQ